MAGTTTAPDESRKPRKLLRVAKAAHYCGLSKSVFDRMRLKGEGPRWSRLGARIVVYDQDDLDAWIDEGKSPPPKSR